jgi:hypothetical protein
MKRPDCAVCGDPSWLPFTNANVPLCHHCYDQWIAEDSCKHDPIWEAMGWDGNLSTATVKRVKEFQVELAKRTEAWAAKQREARAA